MIIARTVAEEMGLKNMQFRTTDRNRGWPGDVPNVIYDARKRKMLGWTGTVFINRGRADRFAPARREGIGEA